MSTLSPGCSAAMRSAPQAVTTTMPSSVTPMPKCANTVPQAERGKPAARRSALPSGIRKIMVRSARSISAPAMTKSASPTPNGASTGPPCCSGEGRGNRHRRNEGRGQKTLRRAEKIAALPAEQRPERHYQQERHEQRTEGRVEEWRADRDLLAGQCFKRERIERADENGRARAGQKQIVEDQRALARDRREQATLLEQRRAPSIKRKRAADEKRSEWRG